MPLQVNWVGRAFQPERIPNAGMAAHSSVGSGKLSAMRLGLMAVMLCAPAFCADVYFNDFNTAPGTIYPEWTSSGYTNSSNRAGTVDAGAGPQTVATVTSPDGRQHFLGEFGGPAIVATPPYDPQHFVRVDETITLTLRDLKPHTFMTVAFDLYILKSWDGNNQTYGPDRWSLRVQGGLTLLDTTFSNNPKTGADLSQQNYPVMNSPHQRGAASVNTLGYTFYGDSIYHVSFNFPHASDTLVLNFSSSLFEGKGTDDESWGLDNVRVSSNADAPMAASAAAPSVELASQALGSIYGFGLAAAPVTAPRQPGPLSLGGVSVTVGGRAAPLLYVSPVQINFEIPAGTTGDVGFAVQTGLGNTLNFIGRVAAIAPGLFTANGDGRGVVAASALQIIPGSTLQITLPVFRCGDSPGSCVSVPVQLGLDTPTYVALYGTGIRGAPLGSVAVFIDGSSVPVLFAGPQPEWEGLDQINIALPLTLRGAGEVDIVIEAGGVLSNTARIQII
jgi:uncharacterized protein (TIGR03437 family)